MCTEKEAENKNIERKSQQLEDEITVLKEKILCLQKEKEETFSNLNEAKHWVEDIDLSQTLEAERSKFIIEITKKDNEIKQVLEEKNKAVLALQEGYDIMKCKNDEIQRKLKEAEDQHAINLKKLTDEAKEEAKRELRKEFEEMKSETVRQNYADKENNEIVTESEVVISIRTIMCFIALDYVNYLLMISLLEASAFDELLNNRLIWHPSSGKLLLLFPLLITV